MTIRCRGLLSAIAGMLLAFSACSASPTVSLQTVRVGLLPILDSLPFRVMSDRGFAAEEGLSLDFRTYEGGGPAIAAIQTGAIEATYAGLFPIFNAVGKGVIPNNALVIAANGIADPQHPAGGLVVGKATRGWKDLSGKRIAINARGSVADVAAEIRLKQEGVRGVTFVEIAFPNMGLAVAGGNVAGASMFEPFIAQSLLRGDGHLLDWIIGGKPFTTFITSALVVSRELAGRSNIVHALIKAHLKAVTWMTAHPDDARAILGRWLGLPTDVERTTTLNAWSQDGHVDATLFAEMQRTLVAQGFSSKVYSVGQVFDERLLPAASASKG